MVIILYSLSKQYKSDEVITPWLLVHVMKTNRGNSCFSFAKYKDRIIKIVSLVHEFILDKQRDIKLLLYVHEIDNIYNKWN